MVFRKEVELAVLQANAPAHPQKYNIVLNQHAQQIYVSIKIVNARMVLRYIYSCKISAKDG